MINYEVQGKMIVANLENGKAIKIDKKFIDTSVEKLDITEYDAIMTYLEDNDHLINEEQVALDKKAKTIKATTARGKEVTVKTPKEKVKKSAPTKEKVISAIAEMLKGFTPDVTIENSAKIVTFSIDNEDYKIDLTQKRKKKGE